MAYVGDNSETTSRGKTLSVLNLAQLLGLGLGTMAGVTLTDLISYHAAFAACLGFSALALAFAYRGARTDVVRGPRFELQFRAPDRRLFSTRVLLLAGIALLLSIATTVQAPAIGDYTHDVLDTKMYILGLMLAAPAAIAFVVLIRCRHLADRFGRQAPLIAGLATTALCYYALSVTSHPLIAVNLVVLAGFAYAISIPAWGAAALDATEFGGRGLVLGVLATVQAFGGAAGQAIGGLTNAAWGPLAPFRMGAILLGLAIVLTIVHLRQQEPVAIEARD
jgi:MFS family permease